MQKRLLIFSLLLAALTLTGLAAPFTHTEARNFVRFEPTLRGHVVDHRLTRLAQGSGAATVFDLNPGVDYATLPNPAAQDAALAQPTALVFSSDGAVA